MRGIRVVFGSLVANEDVNLVVDRGEIHALLGENGAGKSTLMRALAGLLVPAAGALCDLFLLWNLDGNAKLLGLAWLALGICYLAYLTRFFQTAPPEVEFVE